MTVQAIVTPNVTLQPKPDKKVSPWEILTVLSLVKDILAKGEYKIAVTTQKLTEVGNKIQDKQLRDLKEMDKINLEAFKKELESETLRNIALGITIALIVVVPAIGAIKAGSAGMLKVLAPFIAPALSVAAAGIHIKSDLLKRETAEKLMQVAKIKEHADIDAAISYSNREVTNDSGFALTSSSKAALDLQKTKTNIINSTGSAMQTAFR